MLSREAAFRQIEADRVVPIQKRIWVDYDNTLQAPVAFSFCGVQHEIVEIVGTFRETPDNPSVLYLVRAPQGIYALYADLVRMERPALWRGQWVLHFRVEEAPEGDQMLVDMKLKRAADFHGHLCPDLVIGYRASQYALDNLMLALLSGASLQIVMENSTSAVDAVQQLTGCTVGNGRLQIRDYGKHVYTFFYGQHEALRVALRSEAMPDNTDLLTLESRILSGQATMMEAARYQVLLDEQVTLLLGPPAASLFSRKQIEAQWPEKPLFSALALCDNCHEPVLRTHLVSDGDRKLCGVCSGQAYEPEKSASWRCR
jgi:formylmethanofuran dehydrogenase subunit E